MKYATRDMNAHSPNTKENLRKHYRDCAAQLSPVIAAESDARILKLLISLPEYRDADTVFTYVSVFPEPDTVGFIKQAIRDGKRVAVPFCAAGGVMKAKVIQCMGDLEPGGRFKIPSPKQSLPEIEPSYISLALVPGVCFGDKGERLGRGGGYYDRFLRLYQGFSVGICRACAFGADIPEHVHDKRVDAVVTEKGIFRFEACP